MHITFIYPLALWLLLLLPLLWLFTLGTRRNDYTRLGRRRFWALLGLRSLALVALVLALAGAQLVRPVSDLTVVFLIDGSDSVAPAQREQALTYVNEAVSAGDSNDQAAVVVFGQNALVERAPNDLVPLRRLTSTPIAGRTNIEEAIQLGLALFPADAQKRLVLLSDGSANEGRAFEAARLAAVRGVPLDVVALPDASGPDVLVSALDAPDIAREGQSVTLEAHIRSSIATSGQLQILADGELIETREVQLEPGLTRVPISIPGGEAGFRRFEVRLEAQGDTQSLNNRAAAFTDVQGPPRVLLIAGDPDRAAPLQEALEAANARVEVRSPDQVPATQADLQRYAAVVLVDLPARDVPHGLQTALPVYVREQGGSLAMIGGRESFGAGGWRRSPVAAALPVELDPKDTEERPDVALTLVIDRSGSMSSPGGGSGRTKLDLAKEAVYQASLGLEQNDQMGVVAFDTAASWIMPMQPLPDIVDVEQSLSQFNDGGGTDIRSGIELAARALPDIDAKTKHVILLTDGIAGSNYADLINQMRDAQITITVVSIGVDANPELRQIAELGGGRYYRVTAIDDVPRVFLAETVTVIGRDIVEEQFTPVVALPAPVVRGVGELPPLYGYNATEPRQAARTILVSPDGKPILAQWQYGLGRSIAWTSDFKAQWAREWVAWSGFPRFVGGLLDALLPPRQTEGLALEAQARDGQAFVDVTVRDAQGRPVDAADLQGRLLNPQDQGIPLAFTQVGAGRYRATAPADTPGVYLTRIAVLDGDGQALGNLSGGLVVAYSPEYSAREDSPQILAGLTEITAGRESPAPAEVFAPTGQDVGETQEIGLPLLWLALLIWPFDIALRRLFLRRSDFQSLPAWLRLPRRRPRPQAGVTPTTISRLQTARSRVRGTQQRSRHEQSNPPRPAPTEASTTADSAGAPATSRQPAAAQSAQPATSPQPETKPETKPKPQKKTVAQPRPSQPGTAAQSDDALARLLVAKQRARRRQERSEGEGEA
jgi:Mg-chelatase subunit ChlD